MLERLKFRVWDKSEKRFMYRNIYDRNWYTNPRGGKCYQGINPQDEFNYSPYEQCTGLKDKNGELIFEGDVVYYSQIEYIVRFGTYDRHYKKFAYESNHSPCFYLEIIKLPVPLPGYPIGFDSFYCHNGYAVKFSVSSDYYDGKNEKQFIKNNGLEIIGNIHETGAST